MKKLLKKLGVIGLTIAVLAPFIETPKVKANNGSCSTHIQSYFFLDYSKPVSYLNKNDKKYTTFTTFPFVFPAQTSGTNVEVLDATISNFASATETKIGQFYDDYNHLKTAKFNNYKYASKSGNWYVSEETSGFADNVLLAHGVWARYDEDGTIKKENWQEVNKETAMSSTVQLSEHLKNNLFVQIAGAKYDGNDNNFSQLNSQYDTGLTGWLSSSNSGSSSNVIVNYLNYIIDNFNEANDRNYIYPTEVSGQFDFNLMISRQYIFQDPSQETSLRTNHATLIDTPAYWPVVLNVKYQVCTGTNDGGENPTVPGTWTLKYDAKTTDSVVNMPDPNPVTNITTGKEVEVAAGPTRVGYSFKGWCIAEDGSSGCYSPGTKIKSDESKVVTLYAQWGDASSGDQNKHGVVSYVLSFIAVGTIAGGIYLISKKNNFFKQI